MTSTLPPAPAPAPGLLPPSQQPLPAGHVHAWDVDRADEYLDPSWRHRWMPQGGHLVTTPQMRTVAASMPSALDRCAAIALTGPWGSGKSTLIAAVTGVADVRCAVADLARGNTSTRDQWDIISTAVTGRPGTGTATKMQEATREYLHQVPTLLVVDEAQHLGRSTLMQLRWLWSQPYRRFAVILAGSDLDAHLDADPAIGTRIERRIRLRYVDTDRLITLLQHHHPALALTDTAVLAHIDQMFAEGSWRHWTTVMRVISNDWGHTGPITIDLANDAIGEVIGADPDELEAAATQVKINRSATRPAGVRSGRRH